MSATGMPCLDCGKPTWRTGGKSEWYMVRDRIWEISGAPTRRVTIPGKLGFYLCIGCLEIRLGRRLTVADFTDAPVNMVWDGNSDRLNDRLARQPSEV